MTVQFMSSIDEGTCRAPNIKLTNAAKPDRVQSQGTLDGRRAELTQALQQVPRPFKVWKLIIHN